MEGEDRWADWRGKMSVLVACAEPGCGGWMGWGVLFSKTTHLREARAAGWSLTKERGWLCPAHKRHNSH